MKIKKYYSLDECTKQEEVFNILNVLQDAEKIDYEVIEDDIYGDVVKIEFFDSDDLRKVNSEFDKLDVIDFPDYGYTDDDEEEDEEFEDDDFNDSYEEDY